MVFSSCTLYDVVVRHPHTQQDKAVVPEDRLGLISLPHGTSAEHHFLLHSLRSARVKRKRTMGIDDDGRQPTTVMRVMMNNDDNDNDDDDKMLSMMTE